MTNDKAIEILSKRNYMCGECPFSGPDCKGCRLAGALDLAINALRPHGEWIVDKTTREVICSCCKQSRRDTRSTHILFCNHCGADMRGDVK